MPRRVVVTCIGPAVRNILQAETHHVTDPSMRQTFEALLKETPDCQNGAVVGLETENSETKRGRSKRPPSEYNLFISKCLKDRPANQPMSQSMKTCAIEWRQKKQ